MIRARSISPSSARPIPQADRAGIGKVLRALNIRPDPARSCENLDRLLDIIGATRHELTDQQLLLPRTPAPGHLEGIPHNVLNAKQHEREGQIIAEAGRRGAVTIATNMAGRGVDMCIGGKPPRRAGYRGGA